MADSFNKALKRIIIEHYGGNPPSSFLRRIAAQPDAQNTTAQRIIAQAGIGYYQPGGH